MKEVIDEINEGISLSVMYSVLQYVSSEVYDDVVCGVFAVIVGRVNNNVSREVENEVFLHVNDIAIFGVIQ